MFLCSLFFLWNDLKSGVPFTFQRTFRKLFVNGKQPKAQKLTVFPGFAISFSLELFVAPSNYSQLLNSHLLLLFRRVLFFSAFFLFVLFLIAHGRFSRNFVSSCRLQVQCIKVKACQNVLPLMKFLPVRAEDTLTDPEIRPKPTKRYNARIAVFLKQKWTKLVRLSNEIVISDKIALCEYFARWSIRI